MYTNTRNGSGSASSARPRRFSTTTNSSSSRPASSGRFSRASDSSSSGSGYARSSSNSGSAGYAPRRSYGSSAGSSFGGGRSSFGGGSRFGAPRRKNNARKDFIDVNKFINKAIPKEEETYVSTHTFADFTTSGIMLANLEAKGFTTPSPIQDQAIPVVNTGVDVVGIASTGTGKTAAFLIPLINKLMKNREQKVMVLAPTRELAQQIETEFRIFAKGMRLFSVSCVGGAPIGKQMSELSRGVHVVIGTPGRVKDLIDRNKIVMREFHSIVLDEADRMLDMGFIEDMRYILGQMPDTRQSLFFSATFSPEIKRLCVDFLKDPITITIPSRDTASSVDQNVVRVIDRAKKIDQLHDILIQPHANKVLIFRETKRSVDDLADELQGRGFKALALHGDMRNRERERAVRALATGDAHIVIATDVAARGIDIPDISHVINYDIPSTYDTYVHRIGRTGRGTKSGTALTFI